MKVLLLLVLFQNDGTLITAQLDPTFAYETMAECIEGKRIVEEVTKTPPGSKLQAFCIRYQLET